MSRSKTIRCNEHAKDRRREEAEGICPEVRWVFLFFVGCVGCPIPILSGT